MFNKYNTTKNLLASHNVLPFLSLTLFTRIYAKIIAEFLSLKYWRVSFFIIFTKNIIKNL